MNKLVFLLLTAISSTLLAAPQGTTYVSQVEKKLNSLFSDTVNEGNVSAEVERVKGQPKIKCGNPVRSGAKSIIFCTATVKTTYHSAGKKQTGSTICTSLSFVVKNNKILERYRAESFRMCIENIHDASY